MDSLERSERSISQLLRAGVLISGFMIAAGWQLELFQIMTDSGVLPRPVSALRTFSEITHGLAHGLPDSWISLGLMSLIGLPILRVALTLYLFAMKRDKLFVLMTLYVLALLCAGILLGKSL